MRAFIVVGALLLVAGVTLLFVPIRHRERHGINAGPLSVSVSTVERERVHPGVSAALIVGGVALMIAGARGR